MMGSDHAKKVTTEIISSLGIFGAVRFFIGVWIVQAGLMIGGFPVVQLTIELVADALKEGKRDDGGES